MLRIIRLLFVLTAMPLLPVVTTAQSPAVAIDTDSVKVNTPSIVDHITETNGNTVEMPAALLRRIQPKTNASTHATASSTTGSGGYRIQIFSDSNPRSAQGEAKAKASNINSRFPQWKTYVTYDAPYWRLRVGDFTTYEDATDALSLLKEAFPTYKRELRIVRDHINHGN